MYSFHADKLALSMRIVGAWRVNPVRYREVVIRVNPVNQAIILNERPSKLDPSLLDELLSS